jgi:hypothetical protein
MIKIDLLHEFLSRCLPPNHLLKPFSRQPLSLPKTLILAQFSGGQPTYWTASACRQNSSEKIKVVAPQWNPAPDLIADSSATADNSQTRSVTNGRADG